MHARLLILLVCVGISAGYVEDETGIVKKTFGDDLESLKKHTDMVLLSDATGDSQVAVLSGVQGCMVTSTAEGMGGPSLGWSDRELIASGQIAEYINVCGGEDRFWIGPGGGQYSIFFESSVPFDLDRWLPRRRAKRCGTYGASFICNGRKPTLTRLSKQRLE